MISLRNTAVKKPIRILLVGGVPDVLAGVRNYIRPIQYKLAERGHEIHYLWPGGMKNSYDWSFRIKIKSFQKDKNIYWHEVINNPNCWYNANEPQLDYCSKRLEKHLKLFLKKISPDVVHIHENIGFPSTIIEIAKNTGSKVFVTVHEYWWLCLHRVLIDYNQKICEGPEDFRKCARCVMHKQRNYHKIRKYYDRLKMIIPFLIDLSHLRRVLSKIKAIVDNNKLGENNFKFITHDKNEFVLKTVLRHRLLKNIFRLNMCNNVIAVSADVKKYLIKYGVEVDKIIVNHIGSIIAEKKINQRKKVDPNNVNLGFIGGVDLYKGVHVLVDAFYRLPEEMQCRCTLRIYGRMNEQYVADIQKKFSISDRVRFIGKYTHDELPSILKKIDVMVLPSICNDTAAQTIFESYSANIPIIASNTGGFPDFVKDGVNGYLFRPGDSKDLADKLYLILSNTEKIKYFSEKIPPLKTITENALELLSMYEESIVRSS